MQSVNQGLMIYNAAEGVATPLIEYTAESKKGLTYFICR